MTLAPLAAGSPRAEGGRYAWYVVAALLTVSVLGYVDRLILSFLIQPMKEELGLSDTQVGLVTGLAFAILYVLAGIPIGRLIDTRNRILVLAVCVVVWSAATAASGLAVGFLSLFLARVFVGAGEAAVGPAAVSLVGDYFPPERVQQPLGLFTVGLYAGGGLALILGGQLIVLLTAMGSVEVPGLGPVSAWRATFLVLGVPGLVVAALLLATVRDAPRRHRIAPGTAEEHRALAYARANRRLFALAFAAVILWGFNGYGLLNWYPEMLRRSFDMTTSEIAWQYGPAFLLGGTIGSLSLAPVTRAVTRRHGPAGVFLVTSGSMALMTLSSALGPVMPTAGLAVALAFVNLLGSSLTVASIYAIITVIAPGSLRGIYTGAYMSAMNITGGAFGSVLVGLMTDHWLGAARLNLALVALALVFGPAASVLMWLAARAYRRRPPVF